MTGIIFVWCLWVIVATGVITINRAVARNEAKRYNQIIESAKAAELEAAHEEPCWQQAQRDLEWRHVEAGILKDYEMTVCDDLECGECTVTRKLKHDQDKYGDGPRPITWRLK